MNSLDEILTSATRFEVEARSLFSTQETSTHRSISLSESYNNLDGLTTDQADMLRQSLRCVENEIYRAAHVLAWAALADFLQQYASRDSFSMLKAVREKWDLSSLDALRDYVGEHALLDGMNAAGLISKNEKKGFVGLLNKRNECAHPSDYYPNLNETLGYVSECISRLTGLLIKYGV